MRPHIQEKHISSDLMRRIIRWPYIAGALGYRVVCERHNMKQFCNTMMEAKSVQNQHKREGCLEAEIKKPGQK